MTQRFLPMVHKQSNLEWNYLQTSCRVQFTQGYRSTHAHPAIWSLDWNCGGVACFVRYIQSDLLCLCAWAFAQILPVRQRRNFAYPFLVADDAMQMDVHKTLYPFYPIGLCWFILNLLSKMFSTLWLSAMLFLYINCLISISSSTFWFLQISHNLRIINGQNNMSSEKIRNLDTLAKLSQTMRSRTICCKDYRTTYCS